MQVLVPDYLVDYFQARLAASDPHLRLIPITSKGEHTESLDNVEVMYRFYPLFQFGKPYGKDVLSRILREAPNMKWVHSGYAGVEEFLVPELVESDIVLTNGAGAPKRPIAETVLACIFHDAKRMDDHTLHHREGKWLYVEHREVRGLTVAILGLGNVGLETARLCHALDMRVIGTKRHIAGPLPHVDEIFPSNRQDECVAQAEYVVLAAALTPETRGMFGASTIEAMRPEAVLINIGRGGLLDHEATLAALRSGRIRFAYLDAHEPEPLPPDSPYWRMPNVLVMPHNSASSQRLIENMSRIFVGNFARYCAGEPLVNVVDKRTGY